MTFNLLTVEKSLTILNIQEKKIYLKLAEAYSTTDEKKALEILFDLLHNEEIIYDVIAKIFHIFTHSESKTDLLINFNTNLLEFYSKYKSIIDSDIILLRDYAMSVFKNNLTVELERLFLEENSQLEKFFLEYYVYDLIQIYEKLHKSEKLFLKFEYLLDNGLVRKDNLNQIGIFFKRNDRFEDFKNKITKIEGSNEIIKEIEKRVLYL